MIALSLIVSSLLANIAPVVEDAPCREEILCIPSVHAENTIESFEPPSLSAENMVSPVFEETNLYKVDGQDPAAITLASPSAQEALEAPILDEAINFKPSSITAEPNLLPMPALTEQSQTASNDTAPQEQLLSLKQEESGQERESTRETHINMAEVFVGAPIIYSILFLLSLAALTLWIYHLLMTRKMQLMPKEFASSVEGHLANGNWQEALALCRKDNNLLGVLIIASIAARHEGSQAMIERMQTEGKRATSYFWQRLSLLNDVALLAPMIGLLGTVLGMFYAFYDVNRSVESMYALFDGLGISVATTVAGLIVAIMALFFHSSLKYRLVRQFGIVEAKAQQIALHPMAQSINLQPRENHELST
jgi:biopolymer transport protein ExbB